MSDSSSLSARSSTDHTTILGRARRLRDGLIIERVQSIERKKTALKGSKDGLEKFKGTSLPELRTIADYPKFDSAVRAALRPKRGGLELLEYEAFREFKELGIAPPFEIANPVSVDYDPLTATAEENTLREELARLEAGAAATELIDDCDDDQLGAEADVPEIVISDDPADFPLFASVEVCVDGEWQIGEGAYVAAHPDPKTHPGQVFVFRERQPDGKPLRQTTSPVS